MEKVAPDKIKESVVSFRQHTQDLLLELVRCASLQGNERSAQDVMERVLKDLDMKVDRWTLDEKQLSQIRGFSPVSWSLDRSECVVGSYEAKVPNARSLIINGHVDVVPVDPSHLWSREPFDSYVK
jgi:acetylornithine deacetylase